MLERATACLKAGARDSLKCAQQGPRSKRRLHSAFWTHGAGGLDITPWAVSMLPTPTDLPLNHDNIGAKEVQCSDNLPISLLPHDGIFLDFLYPPQALAWLRRTHGQCWERWERRNARRLPEGFVQAPRGHSVRSYANTSTAAARKREEDKSQDASVDLVDTNGVATSQVPLRDGYSDSWKHSKGEEQLSADRLIRKEPSEAQHYPESVLNHAEFADTPGELAEATANEQVVEPFKALRDLIAGRRVARGTDATGQAWKLYMALNNNEKEDVNVKSRLLSYFAARNDDIADAHCISLYYAIPLKDRQLPIYQATLAAILRRQDEEFALGLHKEALRNIPNSHQISKELFKYAVEHQLWRTALTVEAHLGEACEETGQKSQLDMFWLNVSEMPNLLVISTRLYHKILRWRNAKTKTDDQLKPYGVFCAKLSEEALSQVLQAPWHETIPSKNKKLYELEDVIRRWSPNAAKVFRKAISSLLGQLSTADEYARAHSAVSYLYKSYRKCGIARAPQGMLLDLLRKVVKHAGSLQKLRSQSHSISVHSLILDWERDYGQPSNLGIHTLMAFYASTGQPKQLQKWYERLCHHYPDYGQREDALWTLIYVHARRADIRKATEAFEDVQRMAKANNGEVPLKCWNSLSHAYARVGDLDGAVSTFKQLLASGTTPDVYSIHSIAELLARRGDVEGVEDVLKQYDALVDEKRPAALIFSYMQALVNQDEVDRAIQVLKENVPRVKAGDVLGSLTACFNLLMTTYALRRDMPGTMKIYRWMQANKTRPNARTYSALMQVLIHLRQTDGARKILFSVLPRLGMRPTGLHYAIVIAGFINERRYKDAIEVYSRMLRDNIRPTLATQRTYFRAKALLEHRQSNITSGDEESAPLEQVISELKTAIEARDGSDVANKDPGFGYDSHDLGSAAAAYFDSVMYIHGSRRCLEAVAELFRLYREQDLKQVEELPPMRILTVLMNAHLQAGDYKQVELYWQLAKQQADLIAPSQTIPDFKPPATSLPIEAPERPLPEATIPSSPGVSDAAEVGFSSASKETEVQQPQVIQGKTTAFIGPRPAPNRRYILCNAFRHYIASLSKENRAVDMVTVCTRLLSQGYGLDNYTWNKLIEHLCTASPPLVLLAFTLAERFLMANFPGWEKADLARFPAKKSSQAERLQHLRARYLRPGILTPHYRTMVHLAAAYLDLRRTEATQGKRPKRNRDEMQRLVGSTEEVRARASKTLAAVQNMPQVDDHLQSRLLSSLD